MKDEVDFISMKKMYQEAFPDDSKKYIDYFFEEKIKKSEGLLIYQKYDNFLPAMMVLVKKSMVYFTTDKKNKNIENIVDVFCLDAVTTKKEHRGKGYMDRLFKEVTFKKFDHSKIPFLILYTHIPNFYKKYGFTECFNYYELNSAPKNNDIELIETNDLEQINEIYNNTIKADLKSYRNIYTLSNRIDELVHEDGKIYLINYKGKTKGYCFISGNGEAIDEIVYAGDYSELEGSIISEYKELPLYCPNFKKTNSPGLMMKIMNPIEFFKIVNFKVDNSIFKFKLKRKFLDDLNLEILVKNNKAVKITILEKDIDDIIDEEDIINSLRRNKNQNNFLSSIKPLDIYFLERF